ncbi:hypothetical protein ACINNAV82_2750 [Acinetobacter baumannii Naval-82]|nr:hypothetical protein ACINNAV82_2750 [Acinetobacter baumannii Naval-82]
MTDLIDFLNGVCRHERPLFTFFFCVSFLNGVCRHERYRVYLSR